MKTLIPEKGLDVSCYNLFGNLQTFFNEFQSFIAFKLDTAVTELKQKLFYRLTVNDYLQVASITDIDSSPHIVAQLQNIIIEYFERIKYYNYFPCSYCNLQGNGKIIIKEVLLDISAKKKETQKIKNLQK